MKKYYLDLPAGQIHYIKAGQGEPLLLLHQAPMSSIEWENIIPVLAQHFTVYAPDMAGHGQSYEPSAAMNIPDFAQDTIAFMDAHGIDKAFVAGNHSGAALATCLAVNWPERVKKLVISCEMLISKTQIDQFVAAIRAKPLSRDIPFDADGKFISDAWLRYAALAPTASLDTRYKPFIHGQLARLRKFDIHEPVLDWMGAEDWMSQIPCPTLVFGAENDLFFDEDKLEEAKSRIADAQTRVIKDAGALSTFEQPAAIADMLLTFFKQ